MNDLRHPTLHRRDLLQAGSIGLLGLSMSEVAGMRAQAAGSTGRQPKAVIYIFLSGGLAQHDSFDPKPNAPDNIRGEFDPIRTQTPGIHICEHLPRLAQRSNKWALVRSLTHPSNGHSEGHHMMLTGRTPLPVGFSNVTPKPSDFPTIASVVSQMVPKKNNLPSSAVVPFHLIHNTGRTIAGQFAGEMGRRYDPWFIQAAHNCLGYGACPDCFDHQRRKDMGKHELYPVFQPPNLRLAEELNPARLTSRRSLLELIDPQRRQLDEAAAATEMDKHRASAWSLLTSPKVRSAFDLSTESPQLLDQYGRNLFGWSCLLARRLVEVGVSMIQVNLGRNETWDTHGNAFPSLKDRLLPPMDRCVSALLDDLESRGMLESTLVVMAGEFGRTPRISHLPQFYALPGRDHWGAVQTVFLAGGGVRGGTVVGSSDRNGGFPATSPQTPENFASTLYQALDIPHDAMWRDVIDRPHHVYHAEPMGGLL